MLIINFDGFVEKLLRVREVQDEKILVAGYDAGRI